MAKIHVLDKRVAELIAAGEVVERPASVIKELLENTIDAGAKHVTVEIRDGGISYMRVTDDGCGFEREDVPVAFLRHATSKVREQEDLTGIATLGFRGEALASIAAVAKVDLTTCAAGEMVGTHYVIHGGEEQVTEDAGCPEGTTIIIEDLFYNVPARMKFLKKDVNEGNAVAGVVERLALSHPDVAMRFIRNGRNEMQTAGDGDLLGCIRAVFGKPFAAGLIPVDYAMNGVKVSGFICKPEACRPNRTMQHFFVNGRYVRTQTATVAIERAYKGVMMVGRFPTCVLHIDLPADTVDANVHPAKIEVRFVSEKPVFDAVYYAVRSALETGDSIHRVLLREEQQPVTCPVVPPVPRETARPAVSAAPRPVVTPKPVSRSFLDIVADDDRPREASMADGTVKPSALTENPAPEKPVEFEDLPTYTPAPFARPQTPAAPPAPVAEPEPQTQTTFAVPDKPVRLIGEYRMTYILAEYDGKLYIIDKHAAHERILYNDLKSRERADAQMLLAPQSVSVSREEHTALIEHLDLLRQAGIEMEDFGGGTVLVRSFPLILSGTDIDATVREIAAGLTDGAHSLQSAKLDWIYHSSACRAAVKAGDRSTPEELAALAKEVLTREDVRYCPHGRPVCIELTEKELEKQFGRIQ